MQLEDYFNFWAIDDIRSCLWDALSVVSGNDFNNQTCNELKAKFKTVGEVDRINRIYPKSKIFSIDIGLEKTRFLPRLSIN